MFGGFSEHPTRPRLPVTMSPNLVASMRALFQKGRGAEPTTASATTSAATATEVLKTNGHSQGLPFASSLRSHEHGGHIQIGLDPRAIPRGLPHLHRRTWPPHIGPRAGASHDPSHWA